jgi:hypothetical protein
MRRFVLLALLALISAVPALAQEDSPGIAHTTGTIPTGDIHMGTNRIDGSNIVFTGGSLTGLSSLGATGSSALTGGGTLSGTFAGAHTLSGAVTFSAAGTALAVTNNGTFGGTLATGISSTNGLLLSGTTLSVTGTGNGNATVKALGTGSINLQTGATPFTGLSLIDGGASAVNFLRVQPGTTGNGVSLIATGDTAAILNLKAGTSGGSVHSFVPMRIDGSVYQPFNIVLAGAPPASATTTGISQTINLSGNDGATPSNAGINQYFVTDTATLNGLGAVSYNLLRYNTGADGDRVMMETVLQKNGTSASGNRKFLMDRKSLQALSTEGGNGDTITASQTGNIMTVTSAPLANIKVGSVISGISDAAGMPFETVAVLGTGTGGTGTYTMNRYLDFGSQPLTSANYSGSFEAQNQVLQCASVWIDGCQMIEWDLSVTQPVRYKQHLTLSYALNDAAHGAYVDCSLCITANAIPPGTGGGKVMLSIGTPAGNWPIDTAADNTAVLRAQRNQIRSSSTSYPQQFKATYGVDFSILNCGIACWSSPSFLVDGNGAISAGPLRVAYSAAGATITAPGLHVASGSITFGGGGYIVGEQLLEPLSGSMWQVTSVNGSGAATGMSLLHSGYPTSCPGAATPFADLANGTGLKATLTCDTSNGIVLGASTDKVGFYGTAAIVKATPSGACAGSTGCQAIRDALANLGLINSGSISD